LKEDLKTTKPNDWLDLYSLVKSANTTLEKKCECCMNGPEENKKAQCGFPWKSFCAQVSLNQILGRNFTEPQGGTTKKP